MWLRFKVGRRIFECTREEQIKFGHFMSVFSLNLKHYRNRKLQLNDNRTFKNKWLLVLPNDGVVRGADAPPHTPTHGCSSNQECWHVLGTTESPTALLLF